MQDSAIKGTREIVIEFHNNLSFKGQPHDRIVVRTVSRLFFRELRYKDTGLELYHYFIYYTCEVRL